MIKKITGLIIIFSCTIFAQVNPAATDIEFYPYSASDTFLARAEANTINENLLVVYTNRISTTTLYARTVTPAGVVGPQRIVASNVNGGFHDLTWHPAAKRYMLIFKDGIDLKVRVIRANGSFAGGVKKVTTYSNGEFRIGPANKKRFILYYLRGDKLVAMSLKKNGKKFKSEKTLVSKTNGQFSFKNGWFYLSKAMMNDKNESVIIYMFKHKFSKVAEMKALKIDHKLNEIATLPVASVSAPFNGILFAEYDTANKVYGIVFGNSFKIFNEFSKWPANWKKLPTTRIPTQLEYDSVSEQFALLSTYQWEIAGNDQGAKFYMSFFNKSGIFTLTEMLIHSLYNDTVNYGSLQLGFNPGGLYLITWGWDYPTHGGFFGRYFN